MKAAALKYTFLSLAANLSAAIIALLPFHALLTVWLSSNLGHYTALRLWKEGLLLLIAVAVLYLLLTDSKIRSHTLTRRLVWLVVAYAALQLLIGLLSLNAGLVTPKAAGYGILVNLRFLAFFLLVWAIALRTVRLKSNWHRLVIWPAVLVVIFGFLQLLILPTDFLRHLGYGPNTIMPFETVNSNRDYIRIASTLRGPNPLGAYLIIPITATLVLLFKSAKKWRLGLLLGGALAVLLGSYSRSALLGAAVSMLIVTIVLTSAHQAKKIVFGAAVGLVLVVLVGVVAIHKNNRLETIVLHTEDHSSVAVSSNDAHLKALRSGVADIIHQPLGRGPGTAGPASVYNNKPRIAENYYLQIGQEVGVVGLMLFILINAGVGYLLWLRRADALALTLFASLISISLVSLLSHAWTDDTLAYIWWGLAGIAMASGPLSAAATTAPAARSVKAHAK